MIVMSTRARLVDAAAEVFTERGYDGAGVQEIARRAGLTTGPIYANFRGKADLLAEAIESRSSHEIEALLGLTDCSPTELLAALGRSLARPKPNDVNALLVVAVVAARRDTEVATALRVHVQREIDQLGILITRARDAGEIDDDLATVALARFCLALAFGSVALDTLGVDPPDPKEWSAVITRLVSALRLGREAGELPHEA